MNTYTVTYFVPGVTASQPPITVQADEVILDRDFVSFIVNQQNTPVTVCAVPTALNPVIQRTATA